MATKWLIGLVMVYLVLTVVSGIAEGTYIGGTGVSTIWSAMESFQTIDIANPLTMVYGVVIAIKDMLIGLFEIFTWKFSFFVGVWGIFRWLLISISVGMVVSLLLALRGVGSG